MEKDMKELDGCTFTPNIENDNSLISSRAMLRAGLAIEVSPHMKLDSF